MKFRKVYLMALKNPEFKFKSERANARDQDLDSLQHWIFKNPDSGVRIIDFRKFIFATDWELQDEKNG